MQCIVGLCHIAWLCDIVYSLYDQVIWYKLGTVLITDWKGFLFLYLGLWICIIFIHETVISLCLCSSTLPFLCPPTRASLPLSSFPSSCCRDVKTFSCSLCKSTFRAALLPTNINLDFCMLNRPERTTVLSLFVWKGATSHLQRQSVFQGLGLFFFFFTQKIGYPSNLLLSNHISGVAIAVQCLANGMLGGWEHSNLTFWEEMSGLHHPYILRSPSLQAIITAMIDFHDNNIVRRHSLTQLMRKHYCIGTALDASVVFSDQFKGTFQHISIHRPVAQGHGCSVVTRIHIENKVQHSEPANNDSIL